MLGAKITLWYVDYHLTLSAPNFNHNSLSNICSILVTQIFLLSVQHVSPIVVQAVTLPCLKILSQFVKPKPATTKTNAVS